MKRFVVMCAFALCAVVVMSSSALDRAQAGGQDRLAKQEGAKSKTADLYVPGRLLVRFNPKTSRHQAHGLVSDAGAQTSSELEQLNVHIVDLPQGADEAAYVESFMTRPEVLSVELDRLIPAEELNPNDPLFTWYEWHLRKISAPAAWDTTTGSGSLIIAILDTGVNEAHEDLAGKLVPGWNVYDNNADTRDTYGHGTKVAGSATASTNNSVGVASVAWNSLIMPIRISDPGGYASYSTIASGLQWAADHGARVANVSFAATTSSTVTTAAQYFQSKGGVVVMAAGNYSSFDRAADNPYILTVSASDPNDALYSWSNTGNNIDLAAPGSVYTTTADGGYAPADGTSFSAPVVAGVAALVMSTNPNLSASQVQEVLQRSADDRGAAGWDASYGWGRVNAARAVAQALSTTGADSTAPTVSLTSPAGGQTLSGTVTVQVSAADNVGVTRVELFVDGSLRATSTVAPYSFSLNTRKLKQAGHTMQARAYDAAGNVGVSTLVNFYTAR